MSWTPMTRSLAFHSWNLSPRAKIFPWLVMKKKFPAADLKTWTVNLTWKCKCGLSLFPQNLPSRIITFSEPASVISLNNLAFKSFTFKGISTQTCLISYKYWKYTLHIVLPVILVFLVCIKSHSVVGSYDIIELVLLLLNQLQVMTASTEL